MVSFKDVVMKTLFFGCAALLATLIGLSGSVFAQHRGYVHVGGE
jgi:hypothetical protein